MNDIDITQQIQPDISLTDLVTPAKFVEENQDNFKLPQVRWWIRNREYNGMQEQLAVVMISRKPYLVRSRISSWILSQN